MRYASPADRHAASRPQTSAEKVAARQAARRIAQTHPAALTIQEREIRAAVKRGRRRARREAEAADAPIRIV